MAIQCEDRDRIFLDGTAEEWAALKAHSLNCLACSAELQSWRALSDAAHELRDYSDSPALWPRIRRELQQQSERQKPSGRWSLFSFGGFTLGLQTAASGVLVLVLAVSGAWLYRHRQPPAAPGDQSLLKNPALADVERTQAEYEQAIDKLAAQTKKQIENPATPLQANYKEKLLVLDSAIDDLRAQAHLNPSNAYLRQQLLAMYEQKQRTLEDILEEK
ncbi:MAG TPA: hypothetical protein VJN93_00900 [Candidatus Acidoferrum sp.]|nr:hypothetical protein [Candidatus Acidoferrum sp.]